MIWCILKCWNGNSVVECILFLTVFTLLYYIY